MKSHLTTTLMFLMITSTQVLAARPSIYELNTRVNQLEAENAAQQAEIDDLDVRVTALQEGDCPSSTSTRFTDNGDGTICDSLTGLMWEMKDASDDTEDYTNPHDVNNYYTVTLDGTAFSDFLIKLNSATDDPSEVGFAGYTDWRLPTIVELQTIKDCNFSPCFDPIFNPTAVPIGPYSSEYYHSSTSGFTYTTSKWIIEFGNGYMFTTSPTNAYHVRAVRGGR